MKENAVFVIILSALSNSTYAANILGAFYYPSVSHQAVFQPLWKELSLRGHKVTVLTPNPINDSTLTNLTEIDLSFTYDIIRKANIQTRFYKDLSVTTLVENMFLLQNDFIEAELAYRPVQDLLKNTDKKFDLVIVQFLHPLFTALSAKYNCPFITMSPTTVFTVGYDALGNPSHPILNPDIFFPFTGSMTFFERLRSAYVHTWIRYRYHSFILPEADRIAKQYISKDIPYLGEIERTASLLFVNVNPFLHPIRPNVPAVIELRGLHLQKPKPLPKDIKDYLDKANEGAVYCSLGSNVRSANLAVKVRETLTEAFSKLPYKVLWKWEEDNLPNQPPNVYKSKWFPQHDVLRHPNVKVFFTQGGLQSMEETINSGVPVVVMPFYSDQPSNARKMADLGFAEVVDKSTLTVDTLVKVLVEVAENPKYRRRVKEIATVISDAPTTGLDKAVWWTEYVLRHKGAKHLRSPILDLPMYQYYLLDVIGFAFAIFLLVLFITGKILRVIIFSFTKKSKLKIY